MAKVILVPYPAQGHVTPMLNLASALIMHGLEPVLIVPEFIHRRISPRINSAIDGILCVSIADGQDEGEPRDFFALEMSMEKNMPIQLQRFLLEQDGDVACMIVDLLASYAINVGNCCGVKVAGFWPAMLATYRLIASIPKMIQLGIISDSGCPLKEAPICLSPGQPPIKATEMPWLIGTSSARTLRFKFWKRTLDRSATLGCLLVNTFPEECDILLKQQQRQQPNYCHEDNSLNIIPIRPIDYVTDHSRIIESSIGSFWEEDLSCIDWLDNQLPGSVIYISFGSWVSPVGEAKIRSLALALEASRRPFLWVLGPSWREGLPKSFTERTRTSKGGGKMVCWAPQIQVLQHEAVGCYLTHCGWNSTMEAIQCKKRLLCYPIAGDQFLNCAYIVDAWRIGVRLNGFGERDLEEGMRRVMEDREMTIRIERVNEKLMGNEAACTTVANLTTFANRVIRI